MTAKELKAFEQLLGRELDETDILALLSAERHSKFYTETIDKTIASMYEANPSSIAPRWGRA
jgi:hypothetical protein